MNVKKNFFHYRPIFYGFLSLMLALFTSRFIFNGNLYYIIFDIILIICFCIYCIFQKKIKLLFIILSIFIFGLGWWFVGLYSFQPKEFLGECQVVGRISDDIQENYSNVIVVLKDVYVNGGKEKDVSLLINGGKGKIKEGDIISFESKIEKAKLFELQNFNSFYYRDNTPYKATISNFEIVGNKLTGLEQFRLKIKSMLYERLGEQGPIVYAMLFGDKSNVQDEIYSSYQSAGIVHLLTVSGLHISFIIGLLAFILKKCRIKGMLNFIICATIIFLYAFLCNFSPSILRAGIMGLVLTFSLISGKCYDGLNSLGFAGIIILFFMPLFAMDLGFLMSFFCVLAILVISPWLIKFLNRFLPKSISNGMGITIAIQIGVLPFLCQMFSTFNFITFFANLIIIPIFAFLYPVLVIGVLITCLFNFFGFVLNFAKFGLDFIYGVAQFFGQTNLILNLEPINIYFSAALFISFFLISKFFMANKNIKMLTCSIALSITEVLFAINYMTIPVGTTISYCVQNSSESIILTNKNNENIIVDLGNEIFVKKALRAIGIRDIQAVISLQKASVDGILAEKLGSQAIFRCENEEGWNNEIVLSENDLIEFGNFQFYYLPYEKNFVGVVILFDNTSVFILKNKKLNEEKLEFLSKLDFDFVVLGEKSEYAKYFDSNAIIITKDLVDNSDACFERDGNLSYQLHGNNFIRRCLD